MTRDRTAPTPADEDALAIECPQCGQAAGRRCLDYNRVGNFPVWLHVRDIPPDVIYAVSRFAHKARKDARTAAKQARLDAILDEVIARAYGDPVADNPTHEEETARGERSGADDGSL